MKQLIQVGVALIAGTVWAADVTVGFREVKSIHVPNGGGATQDDPVLVDPHGALYKTGAGTLTLSQGAASGSPSKVRVLGGKVVLARGTDRATPTIATAPAVIRNDAAMWMDASKTDSFQLNGTSVTTWNDVRETNFAARQYRFFQSEGSLAPELTVTTPENRPAVNPRWYGADSFLGIRHANGNQDGFYSNGYTVKDYFAVVSFYDNSRNDMSHFFGRRAGTPNFNSRNGNLGYVASYSLDAPFSFNAGYSAQFAVNGRIVDKLSEKPRSGLALLEIHSEDRSMEFEALANGGTTDSKGGGYYSEIIVFQRKLTETERLQVRDYLMRKWGIAYEQAEVGGAVRSEIELASGTSLDVAPSAGEETAAVAVSGEGTVNKTGEGTLVLGLAGDEDFAGTFNFAAGGLKVRGGRFPALSVAGGTSLTVTAPGKPAEASYAVHEKAGTTLAKDTAPQRCVNLAGQGNVRVNALEADVEEINVASNVTLTLEGKVEKRFNEIAATDDPVSVTVPNGNFESGSGKLELKEVGWDAAFVEGWGRNNQTWFVYLDNFSSTYTDYSPLGSRYLVMHGYCTAYTQVTLPHDGYYTFSFRSSAKNNSTSAPARMVIDLFYTQDKTDLRETKLANKQVFGTHVAQYANFPRFYYPMPYMKAGTYYIGFFNRNNNPDTANVGIDEVRIDYQDPSERQDCACAIPNGDFNSFDRYCGLVGTSANANVINHSSSTTCTGWNFSVAEGGDEKAVAFIDGEAEKISTSYSALTGDKPFFFETTAPDVCGMTFVEFRGDKGVMTSEAFTPPAGTYRLQGKLAAHSLLWNSENYTKGPYDGSEVRLRAQVSAGGQVVDLGLRGTKQRLWETVSWPEEFTVDGNTPVVLTVSGQTAGGIVQVDDLSLVSAVESRPEARRNLVRFGNFEDGHRASASAAWAARYDIRSGTHYHYEYHLNDPDGQGYVRAEGRYVGRVTDKDCLYQTVNFPEAGLYRVRFLQRTRFSASQYYGANPLELSIGNASATNVIGRSQVWNGNWEERSFLFNVATAGDWEFAIRGLGATWGGNEVGHTSFVDCVSIVRVKDTLAAAPAVAETQRPRINVKKGGMLSLDFTGTLQVGSLKLGGRLVKGTVNASTHPDYITGAGSLEAVPNRGLGIIVR